MQGALRDLEQRLAASNQGKQNSRAAIDEICRELDQAKQVRVVDKSFNIVQHHGKLIFISTPYLCCPCSHHFASLILAGACMQAVHRARRATTDAKRIEATQRAQVLSCGLLLLLQPLYLCWAHRGAVKACLMIGQSLRAYSSGLL